MTTLVLPPALRLRSLALAASLAALGLIHFATPALAVPFTRGGPGGIGTTDGSSSLELWLKADTQVYSDTAGTILATNGGPVGRWNDLSGNNRNGIADVAGREPTYVTGVLNGRPTLTFTGGDINTGSRLTVNSVSLPTNPYPMTGDETAFFALDFSQAGHRGILSGNGSPNRSYAGGLGTMFAGVGNNFTYAEQYRINGIVSVTTAAANTFQTITGYDNNTPASNVTLRLGSGHGGNPDYGGRMAEVILFSTDLNVAQRVIVENYISSRHAVALNTGGGALDRYAGDTAGNGERDLDVFGVGRFDASNVHLNGGSAGLGIEVSDGSLDNSNEWVFAGHNLENNQLQFIEGDPLEIAGQRWARTWFIDKTTGDSINATLAFDFEDAGIVAPGGANNFQLLYSADDDFSNGYTILDETTLISGGTVTFNLLDADLIDGFYTLGLNIHGVPEPGTWSLLGLGGLGLVWQTRRRRTVNKS